MILTDVYSGKYESKINPDDMIPKEYYYSSRVTREVNYRFRFSLLDLEKELELLVSNRFSGIDDKDDYDFFIELCSSEISRRKVL